MEYMSTREASEKWGISVRRVQTVCEQNKIAGVTRLGNAYAIPINAEKPKDGRIRSGKFVKKQKN